MWCLHCRQDVPALHLADHEYCCPRCGETVCADAHQCAKEPSKTDSARNSPASPATGGLAGQPPSYDDWEAAEELRHIERVLHTDAAGGRDAEAIYRREAARFDLSHADAPAWHAAPAGQSERERRPQSSDRGVAQGVLTWLALSLGTTGFVCGGILLGWSLATGRQELWTVGLPIALVGQIALLIGLVLQLDRLWHDNRQAAAKLDDVDQQLHDLRTTTTLLGSSQGPAGSTFYSHFAGGAGPQLLLTDLKSQLDLLAVKIAQQER